MGESDRRVSRAFRPDPALFQDILEAVRAERIRYAVVRTRRPRPSLPDADDLSEMIAAAVAASLDTEEGRQLSFTLVHAAPGSSPDEILFEHRVAFRAERIRRLAPALGQRWGLGVDQAPGKASLGVWGLMARRQDALEVRAVSPGHVIVRFGLVNIALFRASSCELLRVGSSGFVNALSQLLGPGEEAWLVASYLIQLATAVRTHRHGGTLLIVPTNERVRASATSLEVTYRFTPPFSKMADHFRENLARFREELRTQEGESPLYVLSFLPGIGSFLDEESTPAALPMADLIEAVSRLACIDGAVLLDRDLEILGTGTFIKASGPGRTTEMTQWREWQLGRKWRTRRGSLALLGGTRHQSGAEFAWSARDRVSIVVSQDGTIAAFAWPTGEPLPLALRNVDRFVM